MAMSKPYNRRNAQIKRIKVAQRHFGWDDDTYRDVLVRITGKNSTTKMTFAERDKVIDYCVDQGFPLKPKRAFKRKPKVTKDGSYMSRIEALLADNKLPWSYAHNIGKQMFGVDDLEWLKEEAQLRKVLAALEIHFRRQRKKAEAAAK